MRTLEQSGTLPTFRLCRNGNRRMLLPLVRREDDDRPTATVAALPRVNSNGEVEVASLKIPLHDLADVLASL